MHNSVSNTSSHYYRKASRDSKREDTVIKVKSALFGAGNFVVIAGPCAVENEKQIEIIAERVKATGASVLRGGAFKPRTSPYSFQGLGEEGLRLLSGAGEKTGLPTVSEIESESDLELFYDIDIIQVGARNMQNFSLLKRLGTIDKPILLKRANASTIEELLMSAEYILNGGNENVILCERGIRTFDYHARNTLDLTAVPILKSMTHLPVIVDPSHATGRADLVEPMTLAAVACGADGIMVEVHNEPQNALSDAAQSISCETFEQMMKKIDAVRSALKR